MRLKLIRAPANWTLFLQSTSPAPLSKLIDWLPPGGLLRLEFGSRHVVRADYEPLPDDWARIFKGVELEFLRLDTDGEASATVTGDRAALAAFARRVYGPTAPLELVELHSAEPPVSFLTLPQDEALREAVAAGYYRIPRSLNLDQLAKKLGITSASLSERLRRAEGRIITRYVDAGSASPWDAKTLFDEPVAGAIAWPASQEPPLGGKG